jgi:hypothetical protein
VGGEELLGRLGGRAASVMDDGNAAAKGASNVVNSWIIDVTGRSVGVGR